MSTTWKLILGLIIVALIVVLGWKYMGSNQSAQVPYTMDVQYKTTTAPTTTSNQALNADLTSIDSQINEVDMSSAKVGQVINDQPVAQTE